MKKINWTEIAIAAPMALAFSNLAGIEVTLIVLGMLASSIAIMKLAATKKTLQPVVVKSEGRRRG